MTCPEHVPGAIPITGWRATGLLPKPARADEFPEEPLPVAVVAGDLTDRLTFERTQPCMYDDNQ